ncbi:MAG: hypothetical protein NZ769_05380 [Anaerolineae bacterium]|nr:hypothetical protein [Anaerolineae bacterium]
MEFGSRSMVRFIRQYARRWLPPLLLITLLSFLYLNFRSISFDDGDSYSFMLALRQFNLDLYQPQPPGFPVYIALGRVLLQLVGNPLSALTLLSAISGVVTGIAMYGLGHNLGEKRYLLTSIGAAFLVGFSPMGWLTAEKALSDMPGLAMTLLAIWALWSGRDKWLLLIIGGFLTGLGLGLRPQNGLPPLLLLVWLSLRHLQLRRPMRILGLLIVSAVIGILLWLLPTISAVGGFDVYWFHILKHAKHVRYADSILSAPLSFATLEKRWKIFAETFLLHTTGLTLSAHWNWLRIFHGLAVAVFVLTGIFAANWRDVSTQVLAIWAIISALQVFLIEAVDRPRLFLPILPPLTLLIVKGWARLNQPRWLSPILVACVAFAMLLITLPAAKQLNSIPTPPVQATAYVAANFLPNETVLAAAGSFRAAQVELPNYRLFYLYLFDHAALPAALQSPTRYVVIFDRDNFPEQVVRALSNNGEFVVIEERKFARNPLAHPQHAEVYLQVLTHLGRIPNEEMIVPPGGCIDIGNKEDWRFLRDGWYRAGYFEENIGGVSGRWAGQTLTATLHFVVTQSMTVSLTLRAIAYPENQELSLNLNGQNIGHLKISKSWETYSMIIPYKMLEVGKINKLDLVHKVLSIPFEQTGGASSDRRSLAVAYDWICLDLYTGHD